MSDPRSTGIFRDRVERICKIESLLIALRHGETDPDVLQKLIDDSFDVNQTNHGCTALMEAVVTENYRGIQLLIDNGADVNLYGQVRETAENGQIRKIRETPLVAATRFGFLEVVKILTKNGCDLSLDPRICKKTALHYSCNLGFLDITKQLVECGADINYRGDYSLSPLLEAVMMDHLTTVRYLVENGAELTAEVEESCESAPCLAMFLDHWEVARYLIQAGSAPSGMKSARLDVFSVEAGNTDLWLMLILAGGSLQPEVVVKLSETLGCHSSLLPYSKDKGRIPLTLEQQCRIKLRSCLMLCTRRTTILPRIQHLPLPPRLVDYMKLEIL